MKKIIIALVVLATLLIGRDAMAVETPEAPEQKSTTTTRTTTATPERKESSIETVREEAKREAEQKKSNAAVREREAQQQARQQVRKVRAEVCTAKQDLLKQKVPKMQQSVDSILASIDRAYDQTLELYSAKKLDVAAAKPSIAELELKKANATEAVTALKAQTIALDCAKSTMGQELYSYRIKVNETKLALIEYRKSVKALLQDIRTKTGEKTESTEVKTQETKR